MQPGPHSCGEAVAQLGTCGPIWYAADRQAPAQRLPPLASHNPLLLLLRQDQLRLGPCITSPSPCRPLVHCSNKVVHLQSRPRTFDTGRVPSQLLAPGGQACARPPVHSRAPPLCRHTPRNAASAADACRLQGLSPCPRRRGDETLPIISDNAHPCKPSEIRHRYQHVLRQYPVDMSVCGRR